MCQPLPQPGSQRPPTRTRSAICSLRSTEPSLYTDSGFPAAPGTHYVAVDVTAKNTGDKTYILNVLNFRLKDSDGSLHDPAMTNGPEPLIGSYDSVDSGQEERGFVIFPLADGRDPVELQYQSPTGSNGSLPVPKPSS